MRTKSLLFDDDVIDTFVKDGQAFTVDECLKAWQEGRCTADVARRAISQSIAAMIAVPRREGGMTVNEMKQMLKHLSSTYPRLYLDP